MAFTESKRAPGVTFEVAPVRNDGAMPRMDVTVFVGIAASGPLHTPVAVENVACFEAVFGRDAALCICEGNQPSLALLAPTVRAFFRNGGKRAWIIRVAGSGASSNIFPIPGIVKAVEGDNGALSLSPVFAAARSEGSWSDMLGVCAQQTVSPITITGLAPDTGNGVVLKTPLKTASSLSPGDLVRIMLGNRVSAGEFMPDYVVMAIVDSIGTPAYEGSVPELIAPVHCIMSVWFASDALPGAEGSTITANIALSPSQTVQAVIIESLPGRIVVHIDPSVKENGNLRGALVQVNKEGASWWFTVTASDAIDDYGSGNRRLRLTARGMKQLSRFPADALDIATLNALRAEVVNMDITARIGPTVQRMEDLGFERRHPRFWATLPTDAQLFDQRDYTNSAKFDLSRGIAAEAWDERTYDRFPLASDDSSACLYFPLTWEISDAIYSGSLTDNKNDTDRNGLSALEAGMFLDEAMASVTLTSFLNRADFLRFQNQQALKGIYAALDIDEAAIIAVPDALHPVWKSGQDGVAVATIRIAGPDFPGGEGRPEETFAACNAELSGPLLNAVARDNGAIVLRWNRTESDLTICIQRSMTSDFLIQPETIFLGSAQPGSIEITATQARGSYYYRLRYESANRISPWSSVVMAVADAGPGVLCESEVYIFSTIHAALLRMCAARGDFFAVLSMPREFKADESRRYADNVRRMGLGLPEAADALSAGEIAALSYGALFHPWVMCADADTTDNYRPLPPDGAICGSIARRSLARGAWIAPANEPLHGIVALIPGLQPDFLSDLLDARVNVLLQQPTGFTCGNADTLAWDDDLRPISVRRLLQLLRRAALELGQRYVFETNDDSLRRSVHRGFESMLDILYGAGAFAGASRDTSYAVNTDGADNTRDAMDNGRFFVEIKVAPSVPMTFLTIRLMQMDDRSLVTEVR